MDHMLLYFILLPFAGFLSLVPVDRNDEKTIFEVSTVMIILNLIVTATLSILLLKGNEAHFFYESPAIYNRGDAEFRVAVLFDSTTMVYGLLCGLLGLAISIFSRSYMHRDPGYKRFYVTIMIFYFGLTLVTYSGNFELLFVGWELVGITSYLLIGYYRERYLPVKNALKVVSLYRLSDVLLLTGVWLCHSVFGKSINFHDLFDSRELIGFLGSKGFYAWLIPGIFLTVAWIKSAQFPFSSWLPRAMEGPTTSSAIFYGSLSVHLGLFLMIRIAPLWSDNDAIRILMGSMGLLTALVASSIANVQSSVKTQIAYASIAQIGIMFIELALGLHWVVLLHFTGNALLRTYQLLVSPSVLNYLIHEQFYHFVKPKDRSSDGFTGKLRTTVFMLSLKEWNLDRFQYRFMWAPFKQAGRIISIVPPRASRVVFAGIVTCGFVAIVWHPAFIEEHHRLLSNTYALIGLGMILRSFTERNSAKEAWLDLVMSQVLIVMAVGFNEQLERGEVLLYMSGVILAGTTGYLSLERFDRIEEGHDLQSYYGHVYEHPKLALVFLLSCLGMVGFPVTPTFIGIDLVVTHVHPGQYVLMGILALAFIFLEISALRIYSRIFLGPHTKAYHEIAFKNS